MDWLSTQRAKAAVIPNVVTLTDAATILVDASRGNQFFVTITDDRTLDKPTNAENGQLLLFAIKQDATGGHTLSLHADFRFGEDIEELDLPNGANSISYFGVRYNQADDKFDIISLSRGY